MQRKMQRVMVWLLLVTGLACSQAAEETLRVRMVNVPLPISGKNDDRIHSEIDASLHRFQPKNVQVARPLLVFEFQSPENSAGEGTEFEAALKLARVITSERLAGVRTVAFLPRSVKGHAILMAIACEEIIMAPEAEFGAAGIDEATISPLLRAGYEEIANQRRTVPAALALGMLDRRERLLKAQTLEGVRIVPQAALAELEKSTTISAVNSLQPEGEFALFTGNRWRHDLGYVSHLASDHASLAASLNLPLSAFTENPLHGTKVRAVRVNHDGSLNPRLVDRTIKIMRDQLKQDSPNLLCLWLRSEGGSLDEAMKLVRFFTLEVDHAQVRTVVYVSQEARGTAALVALAADELVLEEGAILGREGAPIAEKQFASTIPQLQECFSGRDRNWSAALALTGRAVAVRKYTHTQTQETRILCDEELAEREDRDDWSPAAQTLELGNGIGGAEAVELGLAKHRVRRFEDIRELYRVQGELTTAKLNWALLFVERLADKKVAGLLLFIGMFALFSELSHPGIGVPGFIAGICFMLFFWANFLHGNANMLELLLFAAGVACILVEIFVAPGVIIFGFGGALMIVASIVLASQTFVLPTNMYQLRQVPGTLFMVIAGGVGGVAGLVVIRYFLPRTPYFNKLMLPAPVADEIERVSEREKLVSYDHLRGKYGVTITPLVPSGKIRVGDEVLDVVSEGTLIDPGTTVIVAQTHGNRVVVMKA